MKPLSTVCHRQRTASVTFTHPRRLAWLVAVLTVASCGGLQGSATSAAEQESTTAAHRPVDDPKSGFDDDRARRVHPHPWRLEKRISNPAPTFSISRHGRRVRGAIPKSCSPCPMVGRTTSGFLVGARRDTPRHVFVSFWDVDKVYAHPCDWSSEPLVDPGRTVEGLVAALVDQPMRNATTPVEVTVDGYQGFMLEWSVPTDIDFSTCDEGFFESWTALGWSSDRYQQGPGQVDRLWILDIDGSRLVIDAMYMPGATEQDREELFAVVDSIQFEPVTDE